MKNSKNFNQSKKIFLLLIKVVNKCIKLIEDYNNKITINKRQKQNMLQVVNEY